MSNSGYMEHLMSIIQTSKEIERRRRIRLSVAAYAYEVHDNSVMSDGEFDKECLLVDTSVATGNRKLDNFFKKNFDPSTGSWIHKHPEKHKLEWIYQKYYLKEIK
jgi:hypothetical protein